MTTHSMRPAVALAWVLGLTLILTRPVIVSAAMAAVNWTLTAPTATWLLGAAFLVAVACVIRGARGWAR
ncbi:hypothetical protein ABTX82_01695 [Streptomyces lavendulae]|uniref:hypothetical protein n=1 Tax=Streptomyces lavendulae TaxID=1914 RepID=UPI003329E6CD